MIVVAALGSWLDRQCLPGSGSPELFPVGGGTQNDIYEVRRGDSFLAALRIPPPTAPESRDEGILREWRIICALRDSEVPHSRAIAVCPQKAVLGRPFFLTGFVEGWSPMGVDHWPEPFYSDPSQRRGLAFELVNGIAELSNVDWQAAGLQDLGRPDSFHERQVDRWTSYLERIKGRELPGFSEGAAWLRARKPIDFIPGLMHGDYQFANVMYEHGAPARLLAIIDWEMGTVGDPKLDLGWVLQDWPTDAQLATGTAPVWYADRNGMPTRDELVEHYSMAAGRQVDDIDYYVVLARWKLGVVLEQGFQRAGDDPKLQALGDMVLDLFERAAELAENTDYRG